MTKNIVLIGAVALVASACSTEKEQTQTLSQNMGVGSLTVERTVPGPANPILGNDFVTYAIGVTVTGGSVDNAMLVVDLNDVNDLGDADDTGLWQDAEEDYGNGGGLNTYKPVTYDNSSNMNTPGGVIVPSNTGATNTRVTTWNLGTLPPGFAGSVTYTVSIPRFTANGKTLGLRASLNYDGLAAPLETTSTIEPVETVVVGTTQAGMSTGYADAINRNPGSSFYIRTRTNSNAVTNSADYEDSRLTIRYKSHTGGCIPTVNTYTRATTGGTPYTNVRRFVSEPAVGSAFGPGSVWDIELDRLPATTANYQILFDVPAACSPGDTITYETEYSLNGGAITTLEEHTVTIINFVVDPCPATTINYPYGIQSGTTTPNDFVGFPFPSNVTSYNFTGSVGHVGDGQYFGMQLPRTASSGYNVTIDAGYLVYPVPDGTTFHGVSLSTNPGSIFKDCSGTAIIPAEGNGFNHADPTASGWFPVDATWTTGATHPFANPPSNADPNAIVGDQCTVLFVRPASTPPDQWINRAVFRACDAGFEAAGHCTVQAPGTRILSSDPDGTRVQTYTYENGNEHDCGNVSASVSHLVEFGTRSTPQALVNLIDDAVPSGQNIRFRVRPQNHARASIFPETLWGVDLFEAKDYVDGNAILYSIIFATDIPGVDENILGQQCDLTQAVYTPPDLANCTAANVDPDCFASVKLPDACQPPRGWGASSVYEDYLEIEFSIPILTSTVGGTSFDLHGQCRKTDALSLGADNEAASWAVTTQCNRSDTVTAIPLPALAVEKSGPSSWSAGSSYLYDTMVTNLTNAPVQEIYVVDELPKAGLNGGTIQPTYGKVYTNDPNAILEESVTANCAADPVGASWVPIPGGLIASDETGYTHMSGQDVAAASNCIRMRPGVGSPWTSGQVENFGLKVIIDALVPNGEMVANKSYGGAHPSLGSGTGPLIPPVATNVVETLVSATPVLETKKTGEIDPARPGYVKWTIQYFNRSGTVVNNADIADVLPAEVTFDSLDGALLAGQTCASAGCTPSGQNADGTGGTFGATIATIAAFDGNPNGGADQGEISYWTVATAGLAAGTVIDNSAETTAAGADSLGIASASFKVKDIAGTKAMNPEPTSLVVGDSYTYMIEVENNEPGPEQVTVVDQLPSDVSFDAGTLTIDGLVAPDTFISGGVLTYSTNLPPGDSVVLEFSVTLNTAPTSGGLLNEASLSACSNPAAPLSCGPAIAATHSKSICGDGIVFGAEICDDGNAANGDGCSDTCALEAGYTCDVDATADGTCDSGGAGSVVPLCGDSIIVGNEVCDDGNANSGDGCSDLCQLEAGYECTVDTAPADGICDTTGAGSVSLQCGNGALDMGEVCDDGNAAAGDGCDASCSVEAGYGCDIDASADGICDTAGAGSVVPICGDGLVIATEVCDDGNAANGDGCSSSCQLEAGYGCVTDTMPADAVCDTGGAGSVTPVCGDSIIVAAEVCDDGNTSAADGCSATCQLEAGYQCVADSAPADGICDTTGAGSVQLICSNGVIDAGEVCDDANVVAGDGCDASCALETGYVCDTDSAPADGICDTAGAGSVIADCGDGLVVATEICDDGNTASGDGCDAACAIEAGYGCDVDTAADGTCDTGGAGSVLPVCGDSLIVGSEVCDDGNMALADGCSDTCQLETGYQCVTDTTPADGTCDTGGAGTVQLICSNGIIDAGEVCDDGNIIAGDGCDDACALEAGYTCDIDTTPADGICDTAGAGSVVPDCGDGVVVATEVCDDGNTAAGDGCDAACGIEAGWGCDVDTAADGTCDTGGAGSVLPICGDSLIVGTEVCDDGNVALADGCSDTCQLETGYQCVTDTTPADGICDSGGAGTVQLICSNAAIDAGEICDDGNLATGDGCDASCMLEPGYSCVTDAGNDGVCDTAGPGTVELTCGNSTVDSGEICDDGNIAAGDGCDPNCQLEPGYICTQDTTPVDGVCDTSGPGSVVFSCGDGVVDMGEACDDGNLTVGDGCDANCTLETGYGCNVDIAPADGICDTGGAGSVIIVCGDGIVLGTEVCDDGNTASADGCDSNCMLEPGYVCTQDTTPADGICDTGGAGSVAMTCGNGAIDASEFCDDGNIVAGDGCDANCMIETGFACVLDTTPADGVCDTAGPGTVNPICGDLLIVGAEFCDDGNATAGDGCSDLCAIEAGYSCDVDVAMDGICDTTGAGSVITVCGDGVVAGLEVCDDANTAAGDGCDVSCMLEPGYVCVDDSNPADGICDTGGPNTVIMTCGNGTIDANEVCDDANIASGDGCDANCALEPGYVCVDDATPADGICDTAGPGTVTNTCGNGAIDPSEICDDGNTATGDGCDANCALEPGYVCVDDTTPADGICDTAGAGTVTMTCGNGVIDPSEICDDSNLASGDGCDANCALEPGYVCTQDTTPMDGICDTAGAGSVTMTCGNGMIDASEVCDDGNITGGDGCDANCGLEVGYGCLDDTNPMDGICDTAGAGSVATVCGDSIVIGAEVCDDGNTAAGDGCDATCLLEPGYVCTDDSNPMDGTCDTGGPGTVVMTCGNGIIDANEVCDDANVVSGDGCTANCALEPGYGCLDDTNPMDGICDTAGAGSVVLTCGNGVVDGNEICDDGNQNNGDGCDDVCGLESGFACASDANPMDGVCDTAGPGSVVPVCGDGIVAGAEVCDDANAANGDGCDATCSLEPGYICDVDTNPMDGVCDTGGAGSVILGSSCGDGNVDMGEVCDDGNSQSGDGCDSTCNLEVGAICAVDANQDGICDTGGAGSTTTLVVAGGGCGSSSGGATLVFTLVMLFSFTTRRRRHRLVA